MNAALVATHAYMDQQYPDWAEHLVDMLAMAQHRDAHGVYMRLQKQDAAALICLYDELYLAVTNIHPNKPPLVAHVE